MLVRLKAPRTQRRADDRAAVADRNLRGVKLSAPLSRALAGVAALVLAAGALLVPATTASATHSRTSRAVATPSRPCGVPGATRAYHHVVWILLENVGYSVIGSSDAPYLNHLAAECGLATNDVAATHPSLPNYIALTSGSPQGISDDNDPASHPLNVPNIFAQLKGRWRSYAESMPTSCDKVSSGNYAAKHNPAVYYTNLGGTCARNDVALPGKPSFAMPFTFVAPNICNDMHSCSVSTGDTWLKGFVPKVLSSPEYRSGSLVLVITFDESDSSSTNQIPTVVLAPSVPRGLKVSAPLTHYSLLRTTEQILHLPFIGGARTARSMLGPFHL